MLKKILIPSIGIITTFAAQSTENYGGIMCGSRMPPIIVIDDRTEEDQRGDYQEQFTSIIDEGYDYSVSKFETPPDELQTLLLKDYQHRAYFSVGYILQNCYTNKIPQEDKIIDILNELSEKNGIIERTCLLEGIVLALQII